MAHIDLYRLDDEEQIATLGLEDYLDAPSVTVIEWPEGAHSWLPDERLLVRFAHLTDTKRSVRIFTSGARYGELVERFKRDTFGA